MSSVTQLTSDSPRHASQPGAPGQECCSDAARAPRAAPEPDVPAPDSARPAPGARGGALGGGACRSPKPDAPALDSARPAPGARGGALGGGACRAEEGLPEEGLRPDSVAAGAPRTAALQTREGSSAAPEPGGAAPSGPQGEPAQPGVLGAECSACSAGEAEQDRSAATVLRGSPAGPHAAEPGAPQRR